ncbi:MAG: O-antigen ligase family protein [Lachnospiraceae bacterium]|jgi:hypothetical protein|nr:O-antigen ligase family protein [Lachnospiraceae bacterium]
MEKIVKKGKRLQNEAEDSFASVCSSITNGIISVCVLILVVVFPLIYDKAYMNIMDVKYICYYVSVLGMLGLLLIAGIGMMAVDCVKYRCAYVRRLMSGLLPKNWKKTFLLSDIAVVLFGLAVALSTFHSEYFYEAFWGNEGRYSGMFLTMLYVLSYLVISRFWKPKSWFMDLFLVTGMIMCIIGITDYFRMDILNFRGPLTDPEESDIFTSTVGNINSYTAYVGMIMGFAATMFITAKTNRKTIWYYFCMSVSFIAIIMGCSDNAYLAIGALFGLFPFVVFRDRECVKRYLIMLASFFTIILCIDKISRIYENQVIGLDSLFRVITGLGILPFLVILLWVLVLVFLRYDKKCRQAGTDNGYLFVRIWGAFSAIVILAVLAVLFDANLGGHPERYDAARNYLIFSKEWGTNRGYIWGAALKIYGEFPLITKILGYGPDTFGILTMDQIPHEMVLATGQFYDSVHNEYIQYLVTIGIAGLFTYMAFLVLSLWNMKKNMNKNPIITGAFGAVLCYAFQAIININLPIVAPMMWLLLSIGIAGGRKQEKVEGSSTQKKNGGCSHVLYHGDQPGKETTEL